MKITKLFVALLAISFSWLALAQDKPAMYASQTSTMQAVVEEIDYEARVVTVRKTDGSTVTFTPSPDVKNLEEVSIGDILHVEYSQSVRITVADVDGVEPGAGELSAITRTEEGEMPAMAAVDATVIIATVVGIDLETNTYKLEGPDGMVNEYVAMNPENLKLAAVGDIVVIEITESVMAAVEKVTPSE
jgi:hypothetical protein